ncbi:hypothetical protein BJ944DRAFT_230820 [Cunninghamella echinulata]|nr:hypothetical protein BJ944DRAFT_230820 [Cunninghamella echinulata]
MYDNMWNAPAKIELKKRKSFNPLKLLVDISIDFLDIPCTPKQKVIFRTVKGNLYLFKWRRSHCNIINWEPKRMIFFLIRENDLALFLVVFSFSILDDTLLFTQDYIIFYREDSIFFFFFLLVFKSNGFHRSRLNLTLQIYALHYFQNQAKISFY